MKKLLLTLGAAVSIATPIAAVVACGNNTTKTPTITNKYLAEPITEFSSTVKDINKNLNNQKIFKNKDGLFTNQDGFTVKDLVYGGWDDAPTSIEANQNVKVVIGNIPKSIFDDAMNGNDTALMDFYLKWDTKYLSFRKKQLTLGLLSVDGILFQTGSQLEDIVFAKSYSPNPGVSDKINLSKTEIEAIFQKLLKINTPFGVK